MINKNRPYRNRLDVINDDAQFQHQAKGQIYPLSPVKLPASRTAIPAPRIKLLFSLLVIALTCCFAFTAVASNPENAVERFAADIQKLSALGDRSTGSRGNEAAAAYIRDRFADLGIETVGSHQFDLATIKHKRSILAIPDRGLTIPIQPILGNAITPRPLPRPELKPRCVMSARVICTS